MDNLWLTISAILVLLMQGGFILLEAGSTRMKNAGHIAGKTIFTVGIASLVFWAVGYGFIYGDGNPFIGMADFFFGNYADGVGSVDFFFQLTFAAIALTIAFGGFAERGSLPHTRFSLYCSLPLFTRSSHTGFGQTKAGWLI